MSLMFVLCAWGNIANSSYRLVCLLCCVIIFADADNLHLVVVTAAAAAAASISSQISLTNSCINLEF